MLEELDNIKGEELLTKDESLVVELREALRRLENNPDFKKVIMEEYLEKHALQLVYMLANDGQKEFIPSIIKDLNGISSLKNYFSVIHNIADSVQVANSQGDK